MGGRQVKWLPHKCDDGSGGWIQADTPVGEWVIDNLHGPHRAIWYPAWCQCCEVVIGDFKTAGAAKGACKRYAKRMAASFRQMGAAGWE